MAVVVSRPSVVVTPLRIETAGVRNSSGRERRSRQERHGQQPTTNSSVNRQNASPLLSGQPASTAQYASVAATITAFRSQLCARPCIVRPQTCCEQSSNSRQLKASVS